MHHRISWLFFWAVAATVSLRAQAPAPGPVAAPAGPMPAGLVLVAKVSGTVTMNVNGTISPLTVDTSLPQSAKVNTAKDSSVVLVFSNGATTQLGAESELVIDEFLQDPFGSTIKVAEMTD